jgi:hypothetical protein
MGWQRPAEAQHLLALLESLRGAARATPPRCVQVHSAFIFNQSENFAFDFNQSANFAFDFNQSANFAFDFNKQ